MSRLLRVLPAVLSALIAGPASAGYVVDGSASDWGITLGSPTNWGANLPSGDHSTGGNGGLGGVSGTATGPNGSFYYHLEDTSDSEDLGSYVGPQYGGQAYDAEFLGAAIDGLDLVISIVSGQLPGTFANFAPGDIRIETATAVFGVEVTGMNYTLDGSGHTTGATANVAQGTVWNTGTGNANWTLSPFSPQLPVQFNGGTQVSTASQFVFNTSGPTHSVIELRVPFSVFGGVITGLQWSPVCGNDLLRIDFPSTGLIPPPSVPEPGALVLMTLGGLGLVGQAIRRRKNAA